MLLPARIQLRLPVLEFRAETSDAFRAGARIPAQTRAEEFVFLFTFQTEAANFPVKLAKFLRVLHPFSHAFGQRGALASVNARAVELGDGLPPDVALGIE